MEIELGDGDGKLYTLVLKAGEQPHGNGRADGKAKAGVSWEAVFCAPPASSLSSPPPLFKESSDIVTGRREDEGTKIFVPWDDFKATYRGKEVKEGGGKLETGDVRRLGFMMRSYFGKQGGRFKLEVWAVGARKR